MIRRAIDRWYKRRKFRSLTDKAYNCLKCCKDAYSSCECRETQVAMSRYINTFGGAMMRAIVMDRDDMYDKC